MSGVIIPYGPRRAFVPYHLRTQRWGCLVVHRRAGKTVACINDTIKRALELTLPHGRYAYVAPFLAQAKEVAWEYLKRYALPATREKNESELWVELTSGARIRIHGADNPDRLRGAYLDGVILDEYADMRPSLWGEVIRPMLADRSGWATFIGTPKGKNAFWEVSEKAQGDADWYHLLLPASVSGIISEAELESSRRDMTSEQYAQEFECDFTAALQGAYYGRDIVLAEKDKRICSVPLDKNADVFASWDLGISDSTAIWVGQLIGQELHFIDYIENSGESLDWYVSELKAKPYYIVEHWLPHDAEQRELTTGKTRKEYLEGRGLKCSVLKRHTPQDRINACRIALNRCWFDKVKCERGLESLRMYQAKHDEKRDVDLGPLHDWASHGADAFGYWVVGANDRPIKAFDKVLEYEPLGIY